VDKQRNYYKTTTVQCTKESDTYQERQLWIDDIWLCKEFIKRHSDAKSVRVCVRLVALTLYIGLSHSCESEVPSKYRLGENEVLGF
jgi:hypothetical protein